jgi:hypothetical protein
MRIPALRPALFQLALLCLAARAGQFTVVDVTIESNKRTRDAVIMAELDLPAGRAFTERGLAQFVEERAQRLENLGIFASARIEPVLLQPGTNRQTAVRLRVVCRDKWTLFPVPLYSYGTKSGHRFSFQLMDFNFFGLNHTIDLTAAAGTRERSVEFDYSVPRLARGRLSLKTGFLWFDGRDFQYARDGATVFETDRGTLSASVEFCRRWAGPRRDFQAGLAASLLKETNRIVLNTAGKGVFNGRDISLGIVLREGRINFDGPVRDGHLRSVEANWLADRGSAEILASWVWHRRFGLKNYWSCRVAGAVSPGREISFDSTGYVRGIRQGEVRANYALYANAEVKLRLVRVKILTPVDLYVSCFLDAANGAMKTGKFDPADTVVSFGPGARIFPVNVGGGGMGVRLDCGMNLTSLLKGRQPRDYLFLLLALEEMF